MTSEPRQLDVKVAAAASSHVAIRDVLFVGLQARHVAPRATNMPLRFTVPPVEAAWRYTNNNLQILLPFRVFVDSPPVEGAEPTRVLELSVSIRIDYEIGDPAQVPEDVAAHYAGVSGFLHAWPYVRAEVQALTAKLGFPPLTLPLVLPGEVPSRVRLREPEAVDVTGVLASTTANAAPRTKRKPTTKKQGATRKASER